MGGKGLGGEGRGGAGRGSVLGRILLTQDGKQRGKQSLHSLSLSSWLGLPTSLVSPPPRWRLLTLA